MPPVSSIELNSLEDLQRLPIIDKALCRERGYEEYIARLDLSKTMFTPTSGSTGKPFLVRIPEKIEMIPPLKVIHAMRQFGWHPLMKGLEIWREDTSTHKNFMRKTGFLKSVSIFKLLEDIRIQIEKEKPDYLFCNRTFFMVLADYFEKMEYNYRPRFLLCTAEEVGQEHRKRLENFFMTKLINVFGCMEAPTTAYTCPEYDNFHVFQTTVIAEIIDKRMIDGEEYGDIAITNLFNDVMPLIRYKTGDIVKVIDEKCACHRNSQVFGNIIGRADDLIKLRDGRVFNYLHFWMRLKKPLLIDHIDKIEQYKIWFNKKNEDILFQFRLNDKVSAEEGNNILGKILEEKFPDITCRYEIVDHIPLSKSGKYKIIEIIED